MRKIAVMDTHTIVIGRVGENEAAQVVWPGLLSKWRGLYGEGTVQLAVRRPLDKSPYPAVCEVSGDDVTWTVSATDTAQHGTGECELSYLVGDTVAKSQTWAAMILRSLTGDEPGEPPEDPAKAWFAAIQSQIGDLTDLTTKAKDNLVAAINEAAKSGSGGGGSVEMRVAGGYIQYSTDGETWENLIAVADLKGDKGDPGQNGYSPSASVTETDDGAEISITDKTGATTATVKNGRDGAGMDLTGATVGQIAKIAAVDTDGKPTKWSPVDMAGGETKPYRILYSQTLSEAAVVKVDADADAAACNEYILSMAIPKGDVAVAYNKYTTILCVVDCVNNVQVVDASYGTLHQARMLKSDDGGAWIDFFSGQTSTATPNLTSLPRTGWSNPLREKVTDLTTTLFDSKVELPSGTIIIIGGK